MTRFVDNGAVRLAVRAEGPEAGLPLVLVMGATASMDWWPDDLLAALHAAGFRTLRFDHRDTGESSRPGGDYTVEDLAGDVLAVMDALGLGSAHLAGMSLGGLIGQMLAVEHPERIASLTLIGAEPLGWQGDPLPGIAPAFMDHFAGFGAVDWADPSAAEAFLLGIARLCSGSGAPFDAGRARARIRREAARGADPAAAFAHAAVGLARDWAGAAGRIGVPTLVIHGADDPILPLANGQALARTIRGARLLVLEGVGHELPARAVAPMATALAARGARPNP